MKPTGSPFIGKRKTMKMFGVSSFSFCLRVFFALFLRHGQIAKTLVSGRFFCASELEIYLFQTQSVRAVVVVGQPWWL